MKRQVPLFRVQASPGADYTTLTEIPEIRKVVLSEAVSAIAEGIEKKKAAVSLFEVAQTDYYIDIDNTKYKEVLENIMNHYIKIEDYDMCIKIRDLIGKI
jgi:signal transduction histidine kinase